MAVMGMLVVLILACAALAWFATNRAPEDVRLRGRWVPLVSQEDMDGVLTVDRIPVSGASPDGSRRARFYLQVRADASALRVRVPDERTRKAVTAHLARLNAAARETTLTEGGKGRSIRAGRDGIFVLEIADTGETQVKVRSLAQYGRVPDYAGSGLRMGSIYLRPQAGPQYLLTGSHLKLALDEGGALAAGHKRLDLGTAGFQHGTRVELTQYGVTMAAVMPWPGDSGADPEPGIQVWRGQSGVYLENGAAAEEVVVHTGQVVEIGGVPFEARVEQAVPLAYQAGGADSLRQYPLGSLFHIVGPASLNHSRLDVGIEGMFREYLEGAPEHGIPPGDIQLTLDASLQMQLMSQVRDLARYSAWNQGKGPEEGVASALIMDARTGAVLAMAGTPRVYDPQDEDTVAGLLDAETAHRYNHPCFQAHNIGSTTKPLFALVALARLGGVRQMVLDSFPAFKSVFGHAVRIGDAPAVSGRGVTDFDNYLIHSVNGYQFAVGMLLLAGITDVSQPGPPFCVFDAKTGRYRTRLVTRKRLVAGGLTAGSGPVGMLYVSRDNPAARAFRDLFDVETRDEGLANDRDISIYGGELLGMAARVMQIRDPLMSDPETELLRRSALCAPERQRVEIEDITDTAEASHTLLGAKRNRWSDVKLAEAVSRIMTGRRVRARIVYRFRDTAPAGGAGNGEEEQEPGWVSLERPAQFFDTRSLEMPDDAFATLAGLLRQVPKRGTAVHLAGMVKDMEAAYPGFAVAGKTGTINEYIPPPDRKKLRARGITNAGGLDSKLFVCTFGFVDANGNGVVEPGERLFAGESYTAVVYLKLARKPPGEAGVAASDRVLEFVRVNLPGWWEMLHARSTAAPKPPEQR